MILEEETFKEFGYYPSDLSPKSSKKILAACDDCGKVRVTPKQAYRSLCQPCARKGERNPNYRKGKKGERNANWKGGLVKRICEYCGTEFPAKPSLIKKGGGRFCSLPCAMKSRKGENHPRWLGGISFGSYCPKFDFAFKEYIRDKFNRVCFLCTKTEAGNGERLSVHHVNYDKDCLCNDNLTCQFVPLCRSCNSKVNHNRKMWEAKIMNMLRNSLKGWYI